MVYNEISENFAQICRIKASFETLQVDFIREIVTCGIQSGEFKAMKEEEITFSIVRERLLSAAWNCP